MKYNAAKGGHAPEHLREAFLECLEKSKNKRHWYSVLADDEVMSFRDTAMKRRWERMSIEDRGRWLTGQLWNCSDILPGGFDEELGSTYAVAARNLRREILLKR